MYTDNLFSGVGDNLLKGVDNLPNRQLTPCSIKESLLELVNRQLTQRNLQFTQTSRHAAYQKKKTDKITLRGRQGANLNESTDSPPKRVDKQLTQSRTQDSLPTGVDETSYPKGVDGQLAQEA